MRSLAILSPYLSLSALVIAVGTAAVNYLGQPAVGGIVEADGASSPASPQARLMFPSHPGPDNRHDNHMVSLAYNWGWSPAEGWVRDSLDKPSVALTLESWFHGLAELNFDMLPPGENPTWPGGRGMGFAAMHDGSFATLMVGGAPYSLGAAGVQITGGLKPDPILSIFEPADRDGPEALRVQRPGGAPGVSLTGGSKPALAFGLADRAATDSTEGTLRIIGDPGSAPIVNVIGTGREATVLAVRTGDRESNANLRIAADGRFEWGDGDSPADVVLTRTGTGRLAAQAEFEVPTIRIGNGAALQAVQVLTVETTPPGMPGHTTRDHAVPIRDVSDTTLLFVNGPEQPQGVALAGVRSDAQGRLVLRFVNASPESRRPTSGRYTILAIVPTAN